MREYLLLMIIGAVILGGGLLVVASSTGFSENLVWSIPAGNYLARFQFDTLTAGSLSVSFTAESGGIVNVYVMTKAQHDAFLAGGPFEYIASDSGTSGSFSAGLTSGGTYFLEFAHGPLYDAQVQYGSGEATLWGVALTPFLEGIGALAVGGVLLGVGLYWRSKIPPSQRAPPRRPYYALPPYLPGGAYLIGPSAASPLVAPSGPAYGAILVSVENRTPAPESLQILIGGEAAGMLDVAAGTTGQLSLHPRLMSSAGASLRIEVVAKDGRRAGQDVFVTGAGPTPVALRIG